MTWTCSARCPPVDELTRWVGARVCDMSLAGQRLAVAVSGGADSVALLRLLHGSVPMHGATLEVVTVDHGLRRDSAADAAFVRSLAEGLGLACRVESVDAGASEASARAARFRVFDALDAPYVALAHHADDQIETVLINLLRGTGVPGLAGMATRRGRYVRPLLDLPQARLRSWMTARGYAWREDPTNAEQRFLRNHIRSELVPLMEEIREGSGRSILALASRAREVEQDLAARAAQLGGLPWDTVVLEQKALARYALVRLHPQMQHRHVDLVFRAAGEGRGVVQLPGGVRLEVRKGRLLQSTGAAGSAEADG